MVFLVAKRKSTNKRHDVMIAIVIAVATRTTQAKIYCVQSNLHVAAVALGMSLETKFIRPGSRTFLAYRGSYMG